MYKRVLTSSNSLVQALVDSNFFLTSKIFKMYFKLCVNCVKNMTKEGYIQSVVDSTRTKIIHSHPPRNLWLSMETY